MAKVLKADCSADTDAFVVKDFTDVDEVYITADVAFDSAAKTFWLGDGYSGDFINALDSTAMREGVYLTDSSGTVWSTEFDGNDPAGGSTTDTYHTVEIHYDKDVVSEAWVDGTLIGTSVPGVSSQINQARCGQWSVSDSDPAAVAYIDNFKVGTTRGGIEIFSEDFEGVDPLSDFTSTFGDVSIVDDPFGAVVGFDARVVLGQRYAIVKRRTTVYFDNVKVGSTLGGSEYIDNDFESGL